MFEADKKVIAGDIFSCRAQLCELEVTVVNVENRSNDLSQTHTICNLGVCVSVCLPACSNLWKVCLQHTAATPETPSINNARTDTQVVFREHITQQTGTLVCMCSPSAEIRAVGPADRQR